ncbi:jg26658, partial [Pararge aegeria aegeria]
MVSGWRVAEEIITLSDHRHIIFVVAQRPLALNGRLSSGPVRRWSLKKLDRDLLVAAAHVAAWPSGSQDFPPNPEDEATWFRGTMSAICDTAMPRARLSRKRAVYWWSEEISQLRNVCLNFRRQYTRARRRRRATTGSIAVAYANYREATKALQTAIANAKAKCWKELLEGLDRDPWGRPYKMVLGKLRPSIPPLTETLDLDLVMRVVDTLFPTIRDSSATSILLSGQSAWCEELEVSEKELDRAVKRLAKRNTAPGPDGIPGRAWILALEALGKRLRGLFNSCLRSGVFPSDWKKARLVLLKKKGRSIDSPSTYRPICLLDEVGKLFERIIASRLTDHLTQVGPDLSECQFGFRQGRSTVDTILRVRAISQRAVNGGGVALA